MSEITIREVKTRRGLREFVDFPETLYRDNPHYVPYLAFDQIETLDPKTNPASGFCKQALYLAYKDGKAVGRVAAIINERANEQWKHKEVRFGWLDFIDDFEVSKALMDKVTEFGKKHSMDRIAGPLGFTDFDPEGMLVDGFDRDNTMPMYITTLITKPTSRPWASKRTWTGWNTGYSYPKNFLTNLKGWLNWCGRGRNFIIVI